MLAQQHYPPVVAFAWEQAVLEEHRSFRTIRSRTGNSSNPKRLGLLSAAAGAEPSRDRNKPAEEQNEEEVLPDAELDPIPTDAPGHAEPIVAEVAPIEDVLPSRERLAEIATSTDHLVSHFPKNPYCEFCQRARMTAKRVRRKPKQMMNEDEVQNIPKH